MAKIPIITKRSRKERLLRDLEEILEETKLGERPHQTMEFLIQTLNQFPKFKKDERFKAIITDFQMWKIRRQIEKS